MLDEQVIPSPISRTSSGGSDITIRDARTGTVTPLTRPATPLPDEAEAIFGSSNWI